MINLSIFRQSIFLAFIAIAVILAAETASACIIRWEKPEELKRQAQVVVQALILRTEAPRQTFRSVIYTYKVNIQSVEQGSLLVNPPSLTYEDLLMHRRGDITACPLKHGSGIEQALKPNSLYRMYLRSASDAEILLAEEVPSQALPAQDGTLSFLGTVKDIKASPLDEPSLVDWVVNFSVDKVTEGEFSKPTFSIRIHSPAQSGLEVGKQYLVEAKWNGAGYDVDALQWMKRDMAR
jgi:hypothetical protein